MKNQKIKDNGLFFHGTKASLQLGEYLKPNYFSNYEKNRVANYIYFTGTLDVAKWGAELAVGENLKERIYIVEPTGEFEDDPNVTDKKFPGNPTRSYRSTFPLKIVAELGVWERHSEEQISATLSFLDDLREKGLAVIED